MSIETMIVVFCGALAGGLVNGLTGFGTGLTALGIWLYAIEPATAATLVLICSIVSQLQTIRMIWYAIDWKRVLAFVIPGVLGVPIGTLILPHLDPRVFKIGVGLLLIAYPLYALLRRRAHHSDWGGRPADAVIGFGGGILGGISGLSGILAVIWTDIRGWPRDQRRSVLQTYNVTMLTLALAAHAASGMVTRKVGAAAIIAVPGSIGAAWLGAYIYRRLADHTYQRIIMLLLLFSGIMLVWTSR